MKANWTLERLGMVLLGTTLLAWACQSVPRVPFERGDAFAAVGLLFET